MKNQEILVFIVLLLMIGLPLLFGYIWDRWSHIVMHAILYAIIGIFLWCIIPPLGEWYPILFAYLILKEISASKKTA